MRKITPRCVESVEQRRRHVLVTLPEGVTLEDAVKTPEAWAHVQHDPNSRLNFLDEVDLLASDGSALWRGCVVTKITPGGVWLSKPQAMTKLDRPEVYFEDSGWRVVPLGHGFGLARAQKDGGWMTEPTTYVSEAAAKHELFRRLPKAVVA